jgi:transcription elongation factor GreA
LHPVQRLPFREIIKCHQLDQSCSLQTPSRAHRQTIEGMLRHALIVEAAPYDGTVSLGATVVVRDDFGDSEYTIVVPAEADIARQRISLDSPLGAAISGHRAGDEVSVGLASLSA